MIWVWFAGAAALLLFLSYWAVFLNRPNPDDSDEPPFERLLSEAAAFYRRVSITVNPAIRNGVGVSVMRFSPVRENRSVLGAKADAGTPPAAEDEPTRPDAAQSPFGTDGSDRESSEK